MCETIEVTCRLCKTVQTVTADDYHHCISCDAILEDEPKPYKGVLTSDGYITLIDEGQDPF